ncbi:hypothetical protein HOD19_02365 [bacterium]|jgi:hypothetical protein|nr:hypothetical protein [bacterium]MBT4649203.1 hypothetical protein [bacterium]
MSEYKTKNANVFVGGVAIIMAILLFLLFSNNFVLEFTQAVFSNMSSAAAHRADAIYWGLPGYLFSLLLGLIILFGLIPKALAESAWLKLLIFLTWLILCSPIYWGLWFNLLKSMGFAWAQSY